MKHIKIIGGVILGLFLIIAGVFWFLRITDVKVEGGEIYSDQEIISSAMSDKSGKKQAGPCLVSAFCTGDRCGMEKSCCHCSACI